MSESPPKTVYLNRRNSDGELLWSQTPVVQEHCKYIRKDLVDRLKGFAVHEKWCATQNGSTEWDTQKSAWVSRADCTCGLTEVLKELE